MILRIVPNNSGETMIVDIPSLHEMVNQNEVQIVWAKKDRHLSDILSKVEAPQKLLLEILESSTMLNL